MVHALKEVWRVVIPGGSVLDLRPRATDWPVEILVDDQVMLAGRVDNAPHVPDEQAADSAIAHMVEDGWLALKKQAACDCNLYWDTPDDAHNYLVESPSPPCTISDEVMAAARELMKYAGQDKRLRLRETLGFAIYRRQDRAAAG